MVLDLNKQECKIGDIVLHPVQSKLRAGVVTRIGISHLVVTYLATKYGDYIPETRSFVTTKVKRQSKIFKNKDVLILNLAQLSGLPEEEINFLFFQQQALT